MRFHAFISAACYFSQVAHPKPGLYLSRYRSYQPSQSFTVVYI